MAGIPKYNIIPCCPDSGTQIEQFHIPDGPGGLVPDGVYVYTEPDIVINGISFITNQCYTIQGTGSNFALLPDAPSFNDFALAEDCNDKQCIACEPALPNAFQVYACCDSANVITLNIDDADITTNGVYSYNGALPLTIGGFTFEPDQCYKIEYVGNAIETGGPFLSTFLFQGLTCELTENCPACPTTPQYLRYASCCDNTVLYFRPYSTGEYTEGVYEYLGTPVNGLENVCYSLTIEDVGVAPIDNITEYGALPEAPDFIENVTFDTLSDTNTNCAAYTLECPSCKKTCYTLYNCDGNFFNTTSDLSAYLGEFVLISDIDGPIAGTWYVLLNSGKCDNAVEDITVTGLAPEPCDCRCFEVTGNPTKITYIDCNGNLTSTSGANKFCSLVYPFVTGTPGQYQISEGDNCVDGECPVLCYKLTNCDTGEVIYSTLQNLSQYVITSSIVTLSGYEGCWEVNNLEEGDICDCPVNVIVLQVFSSCQACLPIIAYKLTNCENSADIKYTYDDLSEYIDEVVKSDCGCYLVELINYQPPSVTTIIIVTSFATCVECLRQYYELTNCNDSEDVIYTYTDVSAYIGQVIKIQGCDSCFTIEETEIPINPVIVTVSQTFETCSECAPPPPCLCSRRTNYSTTAKEYQYIDCNGDESAVIILQPNESTGKLCVGEWRTFYPETDNLEVFGNCLLPSKFNWVCPITIPVKKVKPGYSTPSCDIEKYEKITCKASEIYYKQVMRLRYGISNCCPEDEEKWLVKKELIDLDALRDPDYVCTPVTTCCSQPISSCGCGCNQTLKTCNS